MDNDKINVRPIFNAEMAAKLAENVGQQVFEWCNNETPLEDCIADTKDILQESNGDGYELAREFEHKGYSPNLALVEILDGVGYSKDNLLREAIKKWVIGNKIEPRFQLGDEVVVRYGCEVFVGEITGIWKDTAEYLVCISSKGMTIENTRRAVVKYENTQSSDTIRGISADKVLIDDVKQTFLANELQRDKIKQAIIDTIGSDRPFMDVPDIAKEITQKVMEVVGNTQRACEYCGKPKNSSNYAYHICAARKEVVVTITGGVADVEEIPPGIIVKIRDYDVAIEGCDEDELNRDKEGKRYIEAIFTEDDLVRDEALTDKEQGIVENTTSIDCYVDDDGDPY